MIRAERDIMKPMFKSFISSAAFAATVAVGAISVLQPTAAWSQDTTIQVSRGYPLGAGDILRLEFLNRPELGLDVPIELNGYANFPFAGSVMVAGRTVEELRAELPVLLSGAVLRQEVGNDLRSTQVEANEIVLSVRQYRPIVVGGDVSNPGEVPFTVGMTARMAVFKAQQPAAGSSGPAGSANLFRTRAEIGRVVTRQSVLTALVSGQEDVTPDDIALPPNTGLAPENLLSRANADLDLELAKIAEEKARNELRINSATERMESARERIDNLVVGEQAEAENVKRLEQLKERGLVQTDSLNEARRNSLEVSEFRRRASDAAYDAMLDLEELRVSSRIEDINRQQSWRTEMAALDGELDILMATLASNWGKDATAVVYRQSLAGVSRLTVSMDDLLMPGDIVELDQSWVGQ